MNKAVFWDFDGTLTYKTVDLWDTSLDFALKKYGYSIGIEKIEKHLSSKSTEEVKVGFTWHTPEISYTAFTGHRWWDQFFERFEPFYKQYSIRMEDARKIHEYFREQIIDFRNHNVYTNAAEVLQSCIKLGYKNYILSNNYPELPSVIQGLGLKDYFTDYVVSANVGYEKPRIELYQYALRLANSPDRSYMIGDNPIADIQGGKSAGMKTILVHKEGEFEADYICKNLSEIPALLDMQPQSVGSI